MTASKDESLFGHVLRTLEEARAGQATTQDLRTASATLVLFHTCVLELLHPHPLGKGAIRMEDWGDWTGDQREAFEELKRILESGNPPAAAV